MERQQSIEKKKKMKHLEEKKAKDQKEQLTITNEWTDNKHDLTEMHLK